MLMPPRATVGAEYFLGCAARILIGIRLTRVPNVQTPKAPPL